MIYDKYDEINNDSGCKDTTAYKALQRVKKQERRELIQEMNTLANKRGYQIISIIKLREMDFNV